MLSIILKYQPFEIVLENYQKSDEIKQEQN
jgi:hypothetical protein